jgi:hypothetical protein
MQNESTVTKRAPGRPEQSLSPGRSRELAARAVEVTRAEKAAEQARRDFIAVIVEAREQEGASLRVIAKATGLSHATIHNLTAEPVGSKNPKGRTSMTTTKVKITAHHGKGKFVVNTPGSHLQRYPRTYNSLEKAQERAHELATSEEEIEVVNA